MTNSSPQRARFKSLAANYERQESQAATVRDKFSHFTSRMIVLERLAYLDKFGPQPQDGQQGLPNDALSWLITRWVIYPDAHQQFLRQGIGLASLIEIAEEALDTQRKDSLALQQLKISFDGRSYGAKWAWL